MGRRKSKAKRPSDWPAWFEPKGYPHFDQPIRDPEQIRWLVESPDDVARRAFLPFIRFEKAARKYKKAEGRFVQKPRDLKYASHTDSQILRHYANILSEKYEKKLCEEGFAASVLAYRRRDPPQCNIHFANEAFEWIEKNPPCIALTFDVKDFFEAFDHLQLKRQWKSVMGLDELPPDHYAVFKAITRYAWVERDAIYEKFAITKKKQKDWHQPICTPEQFREIVREQGLIHPAPNEPRRKVGVPQGSPISALLSNIYMIDVDRRMAALARDRGGIYLRYSDDILLLCKPEHCDEMRTALEAAMTNAKLELHDGPGKCSICRFTRNGSGILECDRPLQYLGFTFDGQKVRIRSQTVAKFLRRMRKAVRRERHLAHVRAKKGGEMRMRRKLLYSRYTHLGTNNFITGYAANARNIFRQNAIRKQLKRHWRDLHASLVIEE